MAEMDVTGLTLDDTRLAEIRDLLRYESSISFRSHRAAESMLLLLATAGRYRPHNVNPSVRVESSYVMGCATPECPERFGSDDSGPWAFGSIEELAKVVADDLEENEDAYYRWRTNPDGSYTCGRCVTKADCAANGHQWDDWSDCYCGGSNTGHAAGGPQHRSCNHCYEMDRSGPIRPCQTTTFHTAIAAAATPAPPGKD
jgi:hypothetical protein